MRVDVRALGVLVVVGCGRIAFDAQTAPIDFDLSDYAVPSGLVFERSSPAVYRDAMGVWRRVAPDEPRCAYDPDGTPFGLLVEGARTNFVDVSRGDGTAVDNLPFGWDSQGDTDVTANGRCPHVAPRATLLGLNGSA